MVKMVSMKRTKANREAENEGDGRTSALSPSFRDPEDNGVVIHLHPHHAAKLGMGEPLPVGHKIEFGGTGTVTESHSDERGHRLTMTMDRAGVEHEPTAKGNGIRDAVKAATDASEAKKANNDAAGIKKTMGDEVKVK